MARALCLTVFLLSACYSARTSDSTRASRDEPLDASVDVVVRPDPDPDPAPDPAPDPDPGFCTPGVLSAAEMIGTRFMVSDANCGGRGSATLDVRFVGRSAGRVEVSGERGRNYVTVWPPEYSRASCWFDSESTFVVSRREGLEVSLQCSDGVERRLQLSLYDHCRGSESIIAQITISDPEPLADTGDGWTGGCSGWQWLQAR